MVAQSVHITDKFLFNESDESEVEKLMSVSDCATSYTGVIIACALFIFAQVKISSDILELLSNNLVGLHLIDEDASLAFIKVIPICI